MNKNMQSAIKRPLTDSDHSELCPQFALEVELDEWRPYRLSLTYDDRDRLLVGHLYENNNDRYLYGVMVPSANPTELNLFMTTNAYSHSEAMSLALYLKEGFISPGDQFLIAEHISNKDYMNQIKVSYPEDKVRPRDIMPLKLDVNGVIYPYGVRTQWDLTENTLRISVIFNQNNIPIVNKLLLSDILYHQVTNQIKERSVLVERVLRTKNYLSTRQPLTYTTNLTCTWFQR